MKADVTVNVIGSYCPMPIIKTSQKISEMRVGQILEVLSDDIGIKKDMPAWCETTGHGFLGIEEEKGVMSLRKVSKIYQYSDSTQRNRYPSILSS